MSAVHVMASAAPVLPRGQSAQMSGRRGKRCGPAALAVVAAIASGAAALAVAVRRPCGAGAAAADGDSSAFAHMVPANALGARGPAPAMPARSVGASAPRAEGGVALTLGVGFSLLGAVGALAAACRAPVRGSSTARKALTEIGQVKLNLQAGKATPAPPVGPALGQFGANIAFFVKEYNALTADKVGNICPVIVHVMSDRSFTLEIKTPPTAALLHKAVGKDRGSGKAKKEIIGTITVDQLREIAEIKLADLNIADVTRAMKIVHGTAIASGVNVEGYEEWLASVFPPPASILDRYGPGKENLPPPYNE